MRNSKRSFKLFFAVFAVILPVFFIGVFTSMAGNQPSAESNSVRLHGAPLSDAYLNYLKYGETDGGAVPSSLDLSYLKESYADRGRARSLLPASYDLRDYGLVSPVQNQGIYGTCWTFAALGSAESGLLYRYPHLSFSNMHLAWFAYAGAEEEEFNSFGGLAELPDPFFDGNSDPQSVAALAAWKGPVYSSLVPYEAGEIDESLRYRAEYHLQNAFYLKNGSYDFYNPEVSYPDTATIKRILMEYGAVSAGYTSEDMYFNADTNAWYNPEFSYLDHAILVVGWDDHFSRENFNEAYRPERDGAWLVRNSWGVNWGQDGYFWLSYEDQTLDFGCFYQLEAADNYQKNYQYDTLGWCYSISPGEKTDSSAYMANVFTAEKTEALEAVSFYTTDAGTQYEISVYTNLKDKTDPVSGTQSTAVQWGEEEYAGYHTVRLEEPVLLTEGQTFSVVVKLTNPAFPYPIPVEFCPIPEEDTVPVYMGSGGESYIGTDGKNWSDAAGPICEEDLYFYITNVCVKAFTNPVNTVTYSLDEGPIALGETLSLTAPGADAIYFTVDGGDPRVSGVLYEAPISIDREVTVKAVAKTGDAFGEVRSKTYTQAYAELTDLLLDCGQGTFAISLSDGEFSFRKNIPLNADALRVCPQGNGTITVNGQSVNSADWSQTISLTAGESNEIRIVSEAPGKKTAVYLLTLYRSVLQYDYAAETVSYDEDLYTLTDKNGAVIRSGGSVTAYISSEAETELLLIRKSDGLRLSEFIPVRPVATVSPIDFINERTELQYGESYRFGALPDMSDAVLCNRDYIYLTPGETVYLQKCATESAFASLPAVLTVPERPTMPEDPGIDYLSEQSAKDVPEGIYWYYSGIGGLSGYTEEAEPIPLCPGETLYLQIMATEDSFASEIRAVSIPERPAAPVTEPAAEAMYGDTLVLRAVPGAEYRCEDGDWQESPLFCGLQAGETYAFFVRFAATENGFASHFAGAAILFSPAAVSTETPTPEPAPTAQPSPEVQPNPETGLRDFEYWIAVPVFGLALLTVGGQRRRKTLSR